MAPKKGGRRLSAEDRALWSKVVSGATPLPKARQDPGLPARPSAPRNPEPPPPPPLPEFRIGEKAGTSPGADRARAAHAPTPPRMDARAFKRMSRGRLVPEARIDLHGMTVAAAHAALVAFVLRSASEGRRLVLVITGKGRDDAGFAPERRGILRRQVPHWLETPPIAHAVLEVRSAHQRHGGSGAYYVYLRRRQ